MNDEDQPVAWHTDDAGIGKSNTTFDPALAERWRRRGWPVTPMYYRAAPTAPPSAKDGVGACEWCNGTGWLGGPSYAQPDEGGVECTHCNGLSEEATTASGLVDCQALPDGVSDEMVECEVCRIFGDSNLLRKSATPVNAIDEEMVVRALDTLAPEAVTNRYGYRKGYRIRDVLALDDYEATETMRAALQSVWPGEKGEGDCIPRNPEPIAERIGDMGEGTKLQLFREDDGDFIVSVMPEKHRIPEIQVQFCVPGSGGGSSRKTWDALCALHYAMHEDANQPPAGTAQGDE